MINLTHFPYHEQFFLLKKIYEKCCLDSRINIWSLFVLFLRHDFIMLALDGLELTEMCLPGLPNAGIKGMCPDTWLDIGISNF